MKSIIIISIASFSLLWLPLTMNGENITAAVNGSTVTLNDWGAVRNCGSEYVMEIDEENQHINWIQRDTGLMAVCLCTFNYSVTYGPLESGTYYVDVYCTEPGNSTLFYIGSTTFEITDPITDTTLIYSQYTSDCMGYQSLDESPEKKENCLGENYPDPFYDYTRIPLQGEIEPGQQLMIWNSMGRLLRTISIQSPFPTEILFLRKDEEGRSLPSGIYFYGLKKDSGWIVKKMIIWDKE